MRIQRLEIPAFGPFTNLDLRFDDTPNDFHLIYGLNEAGKSSLLRAIRDLFFGIHGQSSDNFLHDYGSLRIKGTIISKKGDQLIFQRRKGNKNTLLDAEGRQLQDSALTPYLGSVDLPYFSSMFGLASKELRDGAQQLMRGEGNIGMALFSASMGGTPIQKIVAEMQQEAERLFKGNARTNVSIRPAAIRYKDLLRQSREAIISPDKWDKAISDLAEAEAARHKLEGDIDQLENELQWISRCRDALPTTGSLIEEQQKIDQLQGLPALTSDFVQRAQQTRQAYDNSQATVARLTAEIARFRSQLKDYPIAETILLDADSLDRLHQEMGAYRNNNAALADLQAELSDIGSSIRRGMQDLHIAGDFESLEGQRIGIPLHLSCQESASILKTDLIAQAKNSEKKQEVLMQIAALESKLEVVPARDLTPLREALALSESATEADRTFQTDKSALTRLEKETANLHRQLGGAPADHVATVNLPVPAKATIKRYSERMEKAHRDIKGVEDKIIEHKEHALEIQSELKRLDLKGELPTSEALRTARETRDKGWNLVLADWKGSGAKEELIAGTPLEQAFPATIVKADGISDELRLRAESVAQAAEKRIRLAENEARIKSADEKLVQQRAALAELEHAWTADWSPTAITPTSPAEMLDWNELWTEFCECHNKLTAARDVLDRKTEQIGRSKTSLALVLGQSESKEFSLLFEAAKSLVRQYEQAAGRRSEMEEQMKELRSDHTSLKQAHEALAASVEVSTRNWAEQCAAAGLSLDTSPDVGLELLRERKDLLAKFDQWQVASKKSKAAAESIEQYANAVREKAKAQNIADASVEALESALWNALSNARKSKDRHDQLASQIKESEGSLDAAKDLLSQSDRSFRQILDLAGLDSADKLEPLLAQLEKRSASLSRIEDLRNTLRGLARGDTVDAFVTKVRAENADALEGREARALQEKQQKESDLSNTQQTVYHLKTEKENLEKAGDLAADMRQQAESELARIEQDASRYFRLRLATHVLQAQIERFRKENQGPLLKSTGDIFGAITRGRFSGLDAEFDDKDTPVLVAVTSDNAKVPVEGLSDGTRDQLYLSLRLAALGRYLSDNEPMPLILDDLLITFDNARSKAILPQLAALSKRTQVFVFTHHEHLIDLCRQTLGEGAFHLHQLS